MNEKVKLKSSKATSLFELKLKTGLTTFRICGYNFNKDTVYVGNCLDILKYHYVHDNIDAINFFIPTCILTEEQENRIEDYLKKFYNKEEFFIYEFCGKVSGYKTFSYQLGKYGSIDNFDKKSEFYKISMKVKDYDDKIQSIDGKDITRFIKRDWNLSLLLMLKASYIIRIYGNENFELFERFFDIMIKHFDFSESVGLASILLFAVKQENLSSNFAFPYQPSFAHFNNKEEMLLITQMTSSTNPYSSYFTGININHKDFDSITTLSINFHNKNRNRKMFWEDYANGKQTHSDNEKLYFDELIEEYKDYIDIVKKTNAELYKIILKQNKIK